MQEQPRAGAHHRVGRHQLRMREALVDVLVDDVRLVQHQVALDEHRHLVVRVHHRQVLGLVVEVDVDDLEIHALLVQHDAAALAERVGGPGIEGHHGVVLPNAEGAPQCDVLPELQLESSRRRRTARRGTAARRCRCCMRSFLRRLGHVVHVVDEVGDEGLVLAARHGPGASASRCAPRTCRRRPARWRPAPRTAIAAPSAFSWSSYSASTSFCGPDSCHSTCGMPTFGNTRLFQPVGVLSSR